jgi:hypothetical protein
VELGSIEAVAVGSCTTVVGVGVGTPDRIEPPRLSTLKIMTRLIVKIAKM